MIEYTYSPGPMRRIKRVHFVGVGGAGMSGIAEVLHNLGYCVTGSDVARSITVQRLMSLGIHVDIGHKEENAQKADVIVVSSAIASGNPEIQAALLRHIPIIPRAQMLSELMRFKYGITVAGTHGKTTTTSLIASVFADAGLKPTFVVGGKVNSAGANARLGEGRYFIAEADESDASFLHLTPLISIITNIDADHMVTYGNDFSRLRSTFLAFIQRLPFYGLAVLCIDDEEVNQLLPDITCPVVTYGFHQDAHIRAENFRQVGLKNEFTVRYGKAHRKSFTVKLNLAGRHNVQNALASIAVALECGIPINSIKKSLSHFAGVGRRCQPYGTIMLNQRHITLIDDYGHHPEEIKVTYEAIKIAYPEQRVVLIFQPHRYTRTQELFEDFANVLSAIDCLVLLDVYAAGESSIAGVDSKALCRAIRQRGKVDPIYAKNNEEALALLPNILKDGDVLMTQGAGDVDHILHRLIKKRRRLT